MSFLIPAAIGALGGLFGGHRRNQEQENQYAIAQMQRQDQQQQLNRRRLVLSRLFQQYNLNPQEYGFGAPLDVANPGPDPWTLGPMPKPQQSSWWQNALGGALGGVAQYFGTRPADRRQPTAPDMGSPYHDPTGGEQYRGPSLETDVTAPGGAPYQVGDLADQLIQKSRKRGMSLALGDQQE